METSPSDAGPAEQDKLNSTLNLAKVVLCTGATHYQLAHQFLLHLTSASNIIICKLFTVVNLHHGLTQLIKPNYVAITSKSLHASAFPIYAITNNVFAVSYKNRANFRAAQSSVFALLIDIPATR